MNFDGVGGQGGAGFGETLPSTAALLAYAYQRVGRASILNLIFLCLRRLFSRTGGRCFLGISTVGGSAFGGYMPAGREGKCAAPFSFVLPPMSFHGAGGKGGKGFGGSLPSAAALLVYACQRVGRANGVNFCSLRSRFSIFTDRGTVFSGDLYNQRRRLWWIHASGTADEARCTVFFALLPLYFHEAGGRGGAGSGGSLPSATALWVYACQRVTRVSVLNLLFFVLAPFDFLGPGGGVFGGSLQSAAALLLDICQRDGRRSALHRFLFPFGR